VEAEKMISHISNKVVTYKWKSIHPTASHCVPVIWLIFTFIYSYESKVVAVHTIKTYRGSRSVAILILGLTVTWK